MDTRLWTRPEQKIEYLFCFRDGSQHAIEQTKDNMLKEFCRARVPGAQELFVCISTRTYGDRKMNFLITWEDHLCFCATVVVIAD